MDKLLWISEFVPYDNVDHAGGQNHNYHLKYINNSGEFEINLVSFSTTKEKDKLDLDKYKIKNHIFIKKDIEKNIFKKIQIKINKLSNNAGFLDKGKEREVIKYLNDLKNKGYYPKYIILQWTGIIFMIDKIKRIFNDSKIIGIEEDVSFLALLRKKEYEKHFIRKKLRDIQYNKLKKTEIKALDKLDLVVVNNKKDEKLLLDNNLKKEIFCLPPFFHSYLEEKYERKNNNIIFFGAMNRPENYLSVIYFIKNIFIKIKKENMKFIVIGSKPPLELLNYQNEFIDILGYVPDVSPFFRESMCLVAPLVLGAGVKVKILEAMSAGLPIITNDIGIEGIDAKNECEYFHANNDDDYINSINDLLDNYKLSKEISLNAKKFIKDNYDIKSNMDNFILKIKGL
ncbi:glycosyltransferase [Acholeplasma sp. OttesenSCG-928-E16]|nr:glycosyltransferase [Acholeplasma sp. OttesenSCG-928-E16]